jgi:curved DNA-binding protein
MRPMGEGKVVDCYEILQVSPGADQEVIDRTFRLLAKRYHPDNQHTGDDKKFKTLVEAYRILSDPEKRAIHDNNSKATDVHQSSIPFNDPQDRDTAAERRINQAILFIFYLARKRDAMKPGIGPTEIEKLTDLPEKELDFHIWYLKEKGWIQRLESGEFAITASGVDEVMEKNLTLTKDRLLPFGNKYS